MNFANDSEIRITGNEGTPCQVPANNYPSHQNSEYIAQPVKFIEGDDFSLVVEVFHTIAKWRDELNGNGLAGEGQ